MRPSDDSTRVTPVWMLAIAALLLAARIGTGVWEGVHPESRPELVEWTAPSAAADEARARGRLVLYAFTDRRDGASRKLAAELFAEPGRAGELSRVFVPVRIDGKPADDSPEIAALRARFQVTEVPTLVVATPDGARWKTIRAGGGTNETLGRLTEARLELLGVPSTQGRGFRFQIGGRHGGAPDSSGANGDSLRVIE